MSITDPTSLWRGTTCPRCGKDTSEGAKRCPDCTQRTANPFVDIAWQVDAACAGTDPEAFFPGPSESTTVRRATRVCNGDPDNGIPACPVRDACLEYAITANLKDGVWGGLTPNQRHELKRSRGLTNKHTAHTSGPATVKARMVAAGVTTADVRRWANANGHPVSAAGGIPRADIVDAYLAAHPDQT